MTIVVTGGNGFIGTQLTRVLLDKGHTVIVIDKQGPALVHKKLFYIPCDLETSTMPFNVLERTDAIIEIGGGLNSTRHIIESLAQTSNKPHIFISEYIDGDETEATKAEDFGCRVVVIKSAMVIGKLGAMASLWRWARLHITSRLPKIDGNVSWIHINDIVRVYIFALETNTLQGAIKAANPTETTYEDFMKAFKKVTKSVAINIFPFTKILDKDFKREIFLNQKIVPQILTDKGFEFAFTDIEEALREIKHAKN